MGKVIAWQDEFWLPLLQIYLRQPVGLKPAYSRAMVELSMELHIAPKVLRARMEQLAKLSTPRLEKIWQQYADNTKKLKRAVRLWREMRGFGAASDFYEGVGVQETFERDFKPLAEDERLTPVMLVLILDLYFRLVPSTMVTDTPEVTELAKLMRVSDRLVVDVLEVYQLCDPYLNRNEASMRHLLAPCQEVWRQYGNGNTVELAELAEELKAYYK